MFNLIVFELKREETSVRLGGQIGGEDKSETLPPSPQACFDLKQYLQICNNQNTRLMKEIKGEKVCMPTVNAKTKQCYKH